MEQNPSLVVICGPTATGKSEIAFELAKNLDTEIISFDSVQVYKDLDIGTAKPSLDMRSKIPHHLIDEISPVTSFTAGDFRKRALDEVEKLKKKKFIVLVGGTGFYLQALLKGMYDIPVVTQETREQLTRDEREKGLEELYNELKEKDPLYMAKIHRNDRYRIIRGLELLRSGVQSLTQMRENHEHQDLENPVFIYGLNRKKTVLINAIQSRTEMMMAQGWVEETKVFLGSIPKR